MRLNRLAALAALTLLTTLAPAAPPADLPGSADHPLIKRFNGSWLAGQRVADWDSAALPASAELQKNDRYKFKELLTVEGRVTQTLYIAPRGKAALEVWRNYEQALAAAGFKKRFACERDCSDLFFAWSRQLDPTQGFKWAKGDLVSPAGDHYGLSAALSYEQGRLLVGTLGQPGREATVLLYNSLAVNPHTEQVATYLAIVEPKTMASGQVTVDATALQAGLAAEGRVALSGLFFDTGKAELKAESRPQLEAMAELLKKQPALKAWIVGHTDNVGSFDANEKLSLARAQAVVAALTAAPYQVEARRLTAKGLASLAPVAGNGDEAGRARNRRVELVAQ